MDGYWWGVLTPFAIILGILLLYLTGNLFGAIVSWAWKRAHYGLLKDGWIAEDYDEDSREWTTRPGAERLAAALCVCSIESGPCERVDVFHVSGRFWSTSACGEKRTPARPAWTSFPS